MRIQAQVQLRNCFIAASGNDGHGALGNASVAGLIGIRRLRSVSWPIHVAGVRTDEGDSVACTFEPIDKASAVSEGPPTFKRTNIAWNDPAAEKAMTSRLRSVLPRPDEAVRTASQEPSADRLS